MCVRVGGERVWCIDSARHNNTFILAMSALCERTALLNSAKVCIFMYVTKQCVCVTVQQ